MRVGHSRTAGLWFALRRARNRFVYQALCTKKLIKRPLSLMANSSQGEMIGTIGMTVGPWGLKNCGCAPRTI